MYSALKNVSHIRSTKNVDLTVLKGEKTFESEKIKSERVSKVVL